MSIAEVIIRSDARLRLQDVVNQLSEVLQRPIALESADGEVHVQSESDAALPDEHWDARDEGQRAHVQIAHAGKRVGFLTAPLAGFPHLSTAQYDAFDSAAALLGAMLDAGSADTDQSARDVVFSDLLSESPERRRAAYGIAAGRRWLAVGEKTVVRALLTGTISSAIDLVSFSKFLSALRPTPLVIVAQHSRLLFVVGADVSRSVDAMIIEEGRRRGVQILGIGTASVDSESDDLARAADHAALAARIASAISEFYPSVDISSLGGWVLLAGAALDPSRLALISPAAAELRALDDAMLRRTVEVYLDAGGQVTAACAQLFIHRTTLYYRLERLPATVREALADGMQRSTLHFALKLIQLWESPGGYRGGS